MSCFHVNTHPSCWAGQRWYISTWCVVFSEPQPVSWMLIPDQKVKCILQIWYTNFLNHQPNKCNNALNFNMWLHLTSVSLPINSFQPRFFRGKRNAWQAGLKLVKLNSAWNILLHQIVLAVSHFLELSISFECIHVRLGYCVRIHPWGNVDDGAHGGWNVRKLRKWKICPGQDVSASKIYFF